jgi:predicted transglutaminase-like cysteine proteinase
MRRGLRAKAARIAAIATLAFASSGALAHTDRVDAFMTVGPRALPPIGWVNFCKETPERCASMRTEAVQVVLDEDLWRELVAVNAAVNGEVVPETDEDQWGIVERWSYPVSGRGDCEDYVLEKRARLIEAGWPMQTLLVTVVRDRKGDGHAVLTVRTDRGDFILDNQAPQVLAWTKTGYQFIKRQSQNDQNRWVSLGGFDTGLLTAR